MLFKMGKFYEMFEMDAHVGVEVLGLMYMKVSTSHKAIQSSSGLQLLHSVSVTRWCVPMYGRWVLELAAASHSSQVPVYVSHGFTAATNNKTLVTRVQGGNNICCGWQGEQPHCGFPEKNYHQNAERLARAGLKVVVVEQTETPAQLSIRNEERKANKQNQVTLPAQ